METCKGTNCTSDGTTPHSAECAAEYERCTAGCEFDETGDITMTREMDDTCRYRFRFWHKEDGPNHPRSYVSGNLMQFHIAVCLMRLVKGWVRYPVCFSIVDEVRRNADT